MILFDYFVLTSGEKENSGMTARVYHFFDRAV
jgi:hypothetical protein